MISKRKIPLMGRIKPFLGACLFLVPVMMISCDDDDDDDDAVRPTQTIVALTQDTDNLSSLEAALVRFPDLVTALNAPGQNTVFAPSNQAFADLLMAIGQQSLADIPDDVLRDILEYHVISGSSLGSSMLSTGSVQTASGESVQVQVGSGVTLNASANVATADINATNGVVHVIDEVLVPPSIAPIVGTIVAPAYFNKNFTTLIAAVKAASPAILESLLSAESKTLFAPTNEAFAAAGITSLPEQSVLDAVLAYHVVPGVVMAADIPGGSSSAQTLTDMVYISNGNNGVFINGVAQVVSTDIEADNGVVHIIDRTLLPPAETIAEIATRYATASDGSEFTQLVAALVRTQGQGENDLLAAASDAGSNLTVFAPTDAAFMELYEALGVNSVDEIPLQTLIAVLKHHIVAGRVFSTDLSDGEVPTLNGNVMINADGSAPSVMGGSGMENEALLQTGLLNIHATNGVIHVIDKVLLP